MIHSREDYNRMQDPAGLIPEDEPVFLLRAKDKTAAKIVRAWANAQLENPNVDLEMIKKVKKHADHMATYGHEHGIQWADSPKDPR